MTGLSNCNPAQKTGGGTAISLLEDEEIEWDEAFKREEMQMFFIICGGC